jgi:hypothetical protein
MNEVVINREYIGTKNFKYFNLRKPTKHDKNWHIAEIIIAVNKYKVRVAEYDENLVTEQYDYAIKDGTNTDNINININEAMANRNNIYNGNIMIADMNKTVEYFKEKMTEYYEAKIAEEEKKIADIRDKISIVDDI